MAAPTAAAQTPLQKGGELVGRAIVADNAHKYDEALTLYEQAIEFLRQAVATEQNVPTRDSIASKIGEYERRVAAIKQALGRSAAAPSSLPAMPSAPSTAPISAPAPTPSAPAPVAVAPPPIVGAVAKPAPFTPSGFAPPGPLTLGVPPPGYPYPAPPGTAPVPYGVPPAPYPGYPPPPPGAWPPAYPYPYPYPPPAAQAPYPYPYPVAAAPPAFAPAPPAGGGAVESWNVPLGSFVNAPLSSAPAPLPPPAAMPTMPAPLPPVYSSPLVNTLSSHPPPMADHSAPSVPTAAGGKFVSNEITHGAWDGAQIRLRASTPSDVIYPGATVRIKVQIFNGGVTKIDHVRIKLKSLDDNYQPGRRERRATLATRDYYEGNLPMRSGNYDHEVSFQMPNFVSSYGGNSRLQFYISVLAVTGMLTRNLHVRLPVRVAR